tara:strand:+ start:931 stop:1053 length:123 start_codon:yes stop_codon:yes gene_type:complete
MWGFVKEVVERAFFIASFFQYEFCVFWQEERARRHRMIML